MRYKPGDEKDILDLFNTAFGQQRSMDHWNWKFRDNPYGGPWATLARRREDDRLAGNHIVMPFSLNVRGRQVLGVHTLDLVVHEDHRGEGIFEATARDTLEFAREQGARMCLAFPNASSYPGFVRSLGWDRILFPRRYLFRFRIKSKLRRLLPIPVLPDLLSTVFSWISRTRLHFAYKGLSGPGLTGLDLKTSDTVPPGYEDLWNACRSQEVLSLWKDTDYFRWRYDQNPDHKFSYVYLIRDGRITALSVAIEREGRVTLCEFLVPGRDLTLGRALLSKLCLYYWSRGLEEIDFLGYDAGFFDEVFADFASNTAFENVLVGGALGDELLQRLVPHEQFWTLTYGDADYV
jgi:GNAT superfamily N-acetyltransferase